MSDQYPCPACGFLSFSEPPGSYEICDICGWEDDHVQLAHPRLRGGANSESLLEAQRELLKAIPIEVKESNGIRRDPDWRPLSEKETEIGESAPKTTKEYFCSAISEAPLYYWKKK
jgi:hypothetical protein